MERQRIAYYLAVVELTRFLLHSALDILRKNQNYEPSCCFDVKGRPASRIRHRSSCLLEACGEGWRSLVVEVQSGDEERQVADARGQLEVQHDGLVLAHV